MILLIDHGRAERIISSQHEMNETQNPTPNLSVIVGQMKRYVSKKVGQNIWRESFHDHIIRDIIEYNELSEYLKNNIRLWKYDEYYRK